LCRNFGQSGTGDAVRCGREPAYLLISSVRQLLIGYAAAGTIFAIGHAIGVSIAG
jgi:hypothetical protein